MRITSVRDAVAPMSSAIANAYIDFSKMTASIVAVTVEDGTGRSATGYGFNSNGRYAQPGLLRERFIPRLLEAPEAALAHADGGLEPARQIVRQEWAALVEADPRPPVSAKTRLQEWTLGRGLGLPQYDLVSSSGPSHNPVFMVRVSAAGQEAEALGENKRAAEQAAAAALLKALGA